MTSTLLVTFRLVAVACTVGITPVSLHAGEAQVAGPAVRWHQPAVPLQPLDPKSPRPAPAVSATDVLVSPLIVLSAAVYAWLMQAVARKNSAALRRAADRRASATRSIPTPAATASAARTASRQGESPAGPGRAPQAGPVDAGAIADIQLPQHWEPGRHATYRAGPNGLWLHVNLDTELSYTVARRDGMVLPAVLPVRAGQRVRVVDSHGPDDGLGHELTVRAFGGEVHVAGRDAAVEVFVLPSFAEMGRVYKRSADDVAFWQAIHAAPDDDLPRLVYADRLDEQGDPAGPVLRGNVPLTLHYSVAAGDHC